MGCTMVRITSNNRGVTQEARMADGGDKNGANKCKCCYYETTAKGGEGVHNGKEKVERWCTMEVQCR